MRPLLIILLLLLLPAANAIVINEIMYDPAKCSDANCEWVELYNPAADDINITYWYVDGKNISVASMPANTYLIVAKDKNSFLANYNSSCVVIQTAISLSNSGETLYLNDSHKNLVDFAAYGPTDGGNGDDKTLSLANNFWRESLQTDGTPCTKNFEEHDIDLNLEQTNINEITAHLANNGLSDENITLDFYVDGNFSKTSGLELASFDSGDVTFVLENISAGEHLAYLNITYGNITDFSELNFSTALPNADVYLDIDINQSINDYSIYNYPENASLSAEVFVMPIGIGGADGFTSGYDLDFENNWIDAYSDIIDPEVDFGSYDLCAEITKIDNYNDTDLENNLVCANFTIAPPASQTKKRIKTFVEYDKYDLNQTLFWTAQLFPLSPETIGNLTISLQKKGTQSTTELLKIENYNLTENTILSGNFTIPEDWIEGIYKVRAKFVYSSKYFDSQDSGQFWLAGLKDLGRANFTILNAPNFLKFGGFGTVFVKFFAGNYNYDKVKFLVYGYPSQVLTDTSGAGLSAGSTDAAVAVELPNIKRGENYYLALPEFTKQNCDSNYGDNSYRIRVRAYKYENADWNEITTSDLSLPMSGKGNCPEAEKKNAGVKLTGLKIDKQKTQTDLLDLSVADAPEKVAAGDSLAISATVKNNLNTTKKFQIYSYIYSGQKLATEGSWTGNAQTVTLAGGETREVSLENVVKADAELGKYVLRVRAKVDGTDVDWDSEAEIVTPEQSAEATLAVGGAGPSSITGAAVLWRSEKAGNLSVAGLAVIAILLILVVVLIKTHR